MADLSFDFLKLSNQYNVAMCTKIFYWMNSKLSLGESASIIVDSQFKTFDEKAAYKFIRKLLVRTIDV